MTEWVHGWIARGWRRRDGVIENLELWQRAVELVRPHQIQWRWVRGHGGHPQNEYANDLAVRAAREQSRSKGAVASGFDDWFAAKRLAKRLTAEPDPFPPEGSFRPARALPVVTKASLTS